MDSLSDNMVLYIYLRFTMYGLRIVQSISSIGDYPVYTMVTSKEINYSNFNLLIINFFNRFSQEADCLIRRGTRCHGNGYHVPHRPRSAVAGED